MTFSVSHTATNSDDFGVGGELTDGDTITFTRSGTSGALTIEWYLVSFSSGVKVQYKNVDVTGASNTVSIDAGNGDGRFIIPLGGYGSIASSFTRWGTTLSITSDTVVTATRETPDANFHVYFAVVEHDGCTVQELTHTITTSTNATESDTISAVADVDNCLIFATYRSQMVTGIDDQFWTADFASTTQVDFVRTATDSVTAVFIYFVVEFTDGTAVRRNGGVFANTEGTEDITISAVDLARSLPLLSHAGWPNNNMAGRCPTDSSTIQDRHHVRHTLTSTTNHRLIREDTVGAANYISQVVQFAEAGGTNAGMLRRKRGCASAA